jgi:hypothetical protein
MTKMLRHPVEIELSYYTGGDDPERGIFTTRPVDPEHTGELRMAVYTDDDTIGFPPELEGKPLQIEFSGSARALDAFGTYLIALARLNSPDSDPHEHFEEVVDERGGTVHLIVRRRPDAR